MKLRTLLTIAFFSPCVSPLLADDVVAPGNDAFITLTRTPVQEDSLPTNVATVTPDQFKRFDAQNAGQAIARETSIQTLPSGGASALTTVRIRGSTSEQTMIMIDGRPYSGFALGASDLAEIPIEKIDRIEIVRGGVSALYGPNAMGGVVNVITKQPSLEGNNYYVDGDYEVASFGRQVMRGSLGAHRGDFSYSFFGDKQKESGFRDNSDDGRHNVGGSAAWSAGKAGTISFDISSFHSNDGVPGNVFPPIPWNQFNNVLEKQSPSPLARQETNTDYLQTSYVLPLPVQSQMKLRLFGQQRDARYDDASDVNPFLAGATDRRSQTKGGDVQFTLPQGFVIGGNFTRDHEENQDFLIPTQSFMASLEEWGVFAQDTFRIENLRLIASGRYDHNSVFGETKNPRVQAIDDVTPNVRVSGSAGRSFRAPTIDDLYYTSAGFNGNPNLRPETAWTYDAGFELHKDSASLSATYFRANVNDLIQVIDLGNFTYGEENIASARRQGVELELHQVISEIFTQRLNWTYLSNRGEPTGFDHMVTLQYSPHNMANYFLTAALWQGLTFDNILRYQSARYSSADETGTKLGATFTWDLRLAYEFRRLGAYLGVQDITNKRYEEQAGFPLPGRTFYGGCHGAFRRTLK